MADKLKTFTYFYNNSDGKKLSGTIRATSRSEARRMLKNVQLGEGCKMLGLAWGIG